jgi:hypothetical protein
MACMTLSLMSGTGEPPVGVDARVDGRGAVVSRLHRQPAF